MSGIRKHEDFFINLSTTQLDATRYSIYQLSDAIFSSNPNDVLYFIGKGPDSRDVVIEKCATLMPCFHGCDAHENSKIFKPDGQRFCWIKADSTFEGLKQTLYEPEDRVRIQAMRPDVKNDRFIISELQFVDPTTQFGNQKILLNDNLNAIIGGKSSGKSLLLYSIAKSIDPEQVQRTSDRLGFDGYKFNFDFKVDWKNGESDLLSDTVSANKSRKITYIPQLYINHLVEKNNKDELNTLVKGILMQDAEFKQLYDQTNEEINKLSIEINGLVTSYLDIRKGGLEAGIQLKELGKPESIQKGLDTLVEALTKGQQSSSLSPEEFQKYNELAQSRSKAHDLNELLLKKETALASFLEELSLSRKALFGEKDDDILIIKGSLDKVLDDFEEIPSDILTVKTSIESEYKLLIQKVINEINALKISDSKMAVQKDISDLDKTLKPYIAKLSEQQELKKITLQIDVEKAKLLRSQALVAKIATLQKDYTDTRARIVNRIMNRFDLYKSIIEYINTVKTAINGEVSLSSKLQYKKANFELFEQVNKAAIKSDNHFYSLFDEELVNYDLIIEILQHQLRTVDDKLYISDKDPVALKQRVTFEDVLKGLVRDNFEIDYTVTYKGDDLLSMSPGKKGTVLLILFLQISSSEYPILIDQPEDNLDNRTIYELLCQIIKIKKKDRQIIIVSHNANLVVSTDAENIIVADQGGQESELAPGENRFNYVNGSLEHAFSKDTAISNILLSQGIREHVCDILEGGGEAFKQRERKYAIK